MTWLLLALHILLIAAFGLRILLRDDLRPDVRMGWLTVMVLLPYVSCVLYYLFGEVALGRHGSPQRLNVHDYARAHAGQHPGGAQALHRLFHPMPQTAADGTATEPLLPGIAPQWQAAMAYAASINGFAPLPGNHAELMADGNQARARLLADLDAAQHCIDVLYYIWLDDHTGTQVAQALVRAARRGVVCRAMVDGLGSRALLHSPLWRQMAQAGVQLAVALPVSNPLKVVLTSRLDLRNHRKITLVDRHTTYCGSQNCADEAFLVKARFAPWVDLMLRLQGPVVAQMQQVFDSDWGQTAKPPLAPVPSTAAASAAAATAAPAPAAPAAAPPPGPGFIALAIAEGPTERPRSTPHLVSTLLASARREVVISTPYFVPDATVLEALCAAAWRGVQVTLILPARNDSWIVAGASRSNYQRLLRAGVAIHEFLPGLLHAKTLCADGEVALVGSTNLDLRSFDLNFENNVLLQDAATTGQLRARQDEYIRQSSPITPASVRTWPRWRRIWNNLLATLSPVL